MNVFLILNPGSKSGSSKQKFDKIFSMLSNAGIPYEYKITEKLEDAYTFSVEANSLNFDAIVAVGGDGTINNVINGFYKPDGSRNSGATFGVIYTGTSPDFCKSYAIPLNLEKAVQNIINAKKRSIRIGRIELCSARNEGEISIHQAENKIVKYFACCVNIGLGASLAQRANTGYRKYLGDTTGTFSALIVTLLKYKPARYFCTFDSQPKVIEKCYNLSIGITPLIASGIKVPINPKMKDKFYLMGACNFHFSNVLGLFKKVYAGREFQNDNTLWLSYSHNIEVSNQHKNPDIEFDGDPAGYLPCSISNAKDSLEIFVDD